MIKEREKEYEDLGMCGMKKMHIYMKRKDWSESLKKNEEVFKDLFIIISDVRSDIRGVVDYNGMHGYP